jgi:hypothetical protein
MGEFLLRGARFYSTTVSVNGTVWLVPGEGVATRLTV